MYGGGDVFEKDVGEVMDSFLLTDWITIRAEESVSSIAQPASGWLELPEHEDAYLYTDVKQVTNSLSLGFDTAIARQEASFVPLVAPFSLAVGLRLDGAPSQFVAVPLARFLRWRLVSGGGAGAWGATFRIWVAAYAYG